MSSGRPVRLRFLYTGGTLGMTRQADGVLRPSDAPDLVVPYLRQLDWGGEVELVGERVCNVDSSDLEPAVWELLADRIAQRIGQDQGFVVVHGTDTMAYTAAALSFLLQNLPCPVVLTGSQRPADEVRTDARRNLIHSAICAMLPVTEVGLFFGDRLLRGNRATKRSVQSYDAFHSPNLPPLLEMGVDVRQPTPCLVPGGPFHRRRGFSREVATLQLTPGASPGLLDALVDSGTRAIVLLAFGSGNVPRVGWPGAIRRAVDRGAAVIVRTQCLEGAVVPERYEGGLAARDAGALSAAAMTTEATVVKAMHLLASTTSLDGFRQAWAVDLAGEGGPDAA